MLGVEQRLGESDHPRGDEDLVHGLRVLPGTGTTLMDDGLAHLLEDGAHPCHRTVLAAHHDREGSVAGPDVAAADRCIDGPDPSLGGG